MTALLGSERGGFKRAMESLNAGRVGIGAQAVGVAQAALDAALAYAKTRVAFGRPIAELQAIQFMLADMSTQIEAARLLVRRAALLKDRGRSIAREAAEAKLMAAEMAVKVTSDARADPRRLRVRHRLSARAAVPGRARLSDLRGHEPDPAARHRPPAATWRMSEPA